MKLPKNFDSLNLRYLGYTSSNFYDFPDLPCQNFHFSSNDLFPVPFSCSDIKENNLLHFYTDDYRYDSFWHNPERYLERLSFPRYVVSPDFSLFSGMPYALQIYNIYRNRLLSLIMINRGIKVIYNLRWSDKNSLEFCFLGIPSGQCCSVQISSYPSDDFFLGWQYILTNLTPCFIIFFGNPFFQVDIPHFIYPYCHFS